MAHRNDTPLPPTEDFWKGFVVTGVVSLGFWVLVLAAV